MEKQTAPIGADPIKSETTECDVRIDEECTGIATHTVFGLTYTADSCLACADHANSHATIEPIETAHIVKAARKDRILMAKSCPTGNIWCNYKAQCTDCMLGDWYGGA
jgi:hypothetical protein